MDKRDATLEEMRLYWEARAPNYWTDDVFGRNIVRAYLDKLHPRSLLEVGCGNGEFFLIYKNVPNVLAIDWSECMIQRANQRKNRHYLPNLHIVKHDICQCSPHGSFDVALTRTVLMHIPPKHVEKAIRHIVKVAREFIHLEYFEPVPLKPLAPHCFLHNYIPLFERQGCEIIEAYQRPDQPQVLFHFRKNVEMHHRMPDAKLVACSR
jgi:SAM-dependent methyltransferase